MKSGNQPWMFIHTNTVRFNNIENNYYQTPKIRNNTELNNFGNCRSDITEAGFCNTNDCGTSSTGANIITIGRCYGSNLQFTNDTGYPEINQIISRAGLCSVKNENHLQCDLVQPCTNGAINPGTCNNFSPEGGVDKIENGKVYAWAKDGTSTTKVHVYFGEEYTQWMIDGGESDCNMLRNDTNNGFGCEVNTQSVLGVTPGKYTAHVFAKDTSSNFTKYLGSVNSVILDLSSTVSEGSATIHTITCTPTPAISGSSVNCIAQLTGSLYKSYTIPPEGLNLGIRSVWGKAKTYIGTSTSDSCTVNLDILTCNNVNVPPNLSPGKYQIVGHRPGVTWVIPTNDIGIDISPYIVNDSSVGTASCTPSTINKSPTDTAYTNCTFPLTGSPNGVYALPAVNTANGNTISLAAGILNTNGVGNGATLLGNSDPCTISDSTLVCNKVRIPTNTNLGNREIIIHYPNVNYFYGKGFLSVDAPIVDNPPLTDPIFLPPTTLTESPNPQTDGLKIFGNSDYSLTLKDTRLTENSKTSICYFKIKEVTAQNGDTTRGYEKLSSTILTSTSTTTPAPAYDATTKSYKVTYDSTNGVNIKLDSGKQLYTDYNLQVRCTRSDNQLFGRDQKINFLFGAYSVVDIIGVGE